MEKDFKIKGKDIKHLIDYPGGCIATDRITVEGKQIMYMYRHASLSDDDSGWFFSSGEENQAYMDDLSNMDYYSLNTIANYDPAIIPYLDAPTHTSWMRDGNLFIEVEYQSEVED